MSSHQDMGTSPLVPLTDQRSQDSAEPPAARPHTAESSEELQAVYSGFSPFSASAARPYRFSDHIHRDRHLFLKGASIGIGCGPDGLSVTNWHPSSQGGVRDFFVDKYGNVFINGRCVQLGMALGNDRLPCLSRVQLALPSADLSKQKDRERFPHLHQKFQPCSKRRPFNEQINTYVDTQKRIRSVQCLDDLYRPPATPSFPYLSTASPTSTTSTSRRSRHPLRGKNSAPSSSLCIHPSVTHQPVSARSLGVISTSILDSSDDAGVVRAPALGSVKGSVSEGHSPENAESSLLEARQALQSAKQASGNKNYANFLMAMEGGQDETMGRLFQSYPKRMLVMHPGRLQRQRSELKSRARLNML